jgi:hypothetical protein
MLGQNFSIPYKIDYQKRAAPENFLHKILANKDSVPNFTRSQMPTISTGISSPQSASLQIEKVI